MQKLTFFFSFSFLLQLFCFGQSSPSRLDSTLSLQEVSVKGRKKTVVFKANKQIYQSSQFASAIGGTGVDLVKNLPSVNTDGMGQLLFRGSSSFQIQINGKFIQGDPTVILGQLSASSIESIEVITNPSVANDADGKSGILNIITKTAAENGWMTQVSLMGGAPPLNNFDNSRYNDPARFSADITAGFRRKGTDISGGFYYVRNDMAGYRIGDAFTIIDNIKTSFPSEGERSFQRYNYGARVSISQDIDKHNRITAGLYAGKRFQSRVADLLYHNTREDLTTGNKSNFTYFNENTQNKEGLFSLASIDYTHRFTDGSALSFTTLYENADLKGLTLNNNLFFPTLKDTIQYTRNPSVNPLHAWRFKTDYSRKTLHGLIQAGYQYRIDKQEGNFLYETKVNGTDEYVIDPEFTSGVRTTNHIQAAYSQYEASWGKWSYTAGLRLEHTLRNISFSRNYENRELSLWNLFPTAQVRYKLEKGNIRLGYNRRIKRTNNYELNPFPEREHSETLEQGDPDLLPELTGTYELGLEKTFPGGSFFATVYHQSIKNPIQRVNKVYNDTILNRIYTNAGNARQTGLESNISYRISDIWQATLGGNLYWYSIKGALFNGSVPVNNSSLIYSVNTNQTFSFKDNWQAQLTINYTSRRITAQGEDSYFLTPNFSLRKQTRDKRWSFTFQWLYMDAGLGISNRQTISTWGKDFFTSTRYIYEPDQLQFSVNFNLSKRNRKITLPSSEIGEKEF